MITDDIKRLYFYEKQFLGARDFTDEQSYHIEMRRRHLIAHHNWGIVAGLGVVQDSNSLIWSVQPGMAVDGYGREILVFDPEPLDIQSIADQLVNESPPVFLKVWIAYQIEKANQPAAGFSVCDLPDQFMRTRETFRLIYQDDPPFDLRKGADPTKKDPGLEDNWPPAYQDLPDDPGVRWPVYLGTLRWDPVQKIITGIDLIDSKDNQARRYVGVIAEEIEAPNNKLTIRGRGNSRPLTTNENGVPVTIEGSLEVERQFLADTDANVVGSLGVGIGTAKADTKLQVSGGVDSSLDNGTGFLVIGPVGGKNLVIDDHSVMARNNKAAANLQIQAKGGDLIVHKDQAGKEFVVKDTGEVGIGTAAPTQLLTLGAPEGTRLEIARTSATLPWSQSSGAINPGAFVINQQSQGSTQPGADFALMRDGKKRVILGDTSTFLSSQDNGDLLFFINREEAAEAEVMRINAAGNVGIGTANPAAKLDVNGDIRCHTTSGGSWSYTEKIFFAASVTTNSLAWVELVNYTRTISTPALANLIVTVHIPFTGNDTAAKRSRIRLDFDGVPISDASKFNETIWELHEITLTGLVANVAAGVHTLKLFAMVDGGTLNIPHFNAALIESTAPALFANLFLVGFY
jgi:hypothetical protein